MAHLQKFCEKEADGPGRTNVVIVPGHNGDKLADQTCSHFPKWLQHQVASRGNSTVVWMFCHELQVVSLSSWYDYCLAGERLLQHLLNLQRDLSLSEDDSLILYGHKLGSFILKKALLEAHRISYKKHVDELLDSIETIAMLGDPFLDPDNQSEWIPLITKCLPCKTLPRHLSVPQDAKCLEHVACRFEEFTIQSALFQVSGSAHSSRRNILKLRRFTETPQCICSANMSVRMWTTAAEELAVTPGDGVRGNCAFNADSTLYRPLLSMPDVGSHNSILNSARMLRISSHMGDVVQSGSILNSENRSKSTKSDPAANQANTLTIASTMFTDPADSDDVGPTSATDNEYDHRAVDASEELCQQFSSPSTSLHGSSALSVSTTNEETSRVPENDTCAQKGAVEKDLSRAQTLRESMAKQEHCVYPVLQQSPSDTQTVPSSTYGSRRAHVFSSPIPDRDTNFVGREDILLHLERLLTPTSRQSGKISETSSHCSVTILQGTGGIGKSAIALEVTYRIQESFDHVVWLRGYSELHLAQSIHEAAISLRLVKDRGNYDHKSSRLKLFNWLSECKKSWLLVIDDFDEPQILPIPKISRGSILVTSRRLHSWEAFRDIGAHVRCVEVPPLDSRQAFLLLQSLAPSVIRSTPSEARSTVSEKTSNNIIRHLHHVPLFICRLGEILSHTNIPAARSIMASLEQAGARVLVSQPHCYLLFGYRSPTSRALANVITFFDPYCIDDALLLGAQRCKHFPLMKFPMTDHDYFRARDELRTQALLKGKAGEESFNLHRVTEISLRRELDAVHFRQGFRGACLLLEERWPSRRKLKNVVLGNWPEFDSLHNHVHELFSIYKDYMREAGSLCLFVEALDEVDDAYLNILILSTWFNALRGNAEEDRELVRLAHGLIARSGINPSDCTHRRIAKARGKCLSCASLQRAAPTPQLPYRVIDVSLSSDESPRVVETAGQTGCYVAISHVWAPSHEWQAAMELTRKLGVRYMWVDSLCDAPIEEEGRSTLTSRLREIYSSAMITMVASHDQADVSFQSPHYRAIECGPFSMFVNWSQPRNALALEKGLQTPSWSWNFRSWTKQELVLSLASITFLMTQTRQAMTAAMELLQLDKSEVDAKEDHHPVYVDKGIQTETEIHEIDEMEGRLKIEEATQYAEIGKYFEALASFMAAKELACVFKVCNPEFQEIHAVASAGLAKIYLIQNLPAIAMNIAEAALTYHCDHSTSNHRLLPGFCRLHSVMGNIQAKLNNSTESLAYYNRARNDPIDVSNKNSNIAGWKSFIDFKLAEHLIIGKSCKEAHALIQQSLEYFQTQETVSAQAQLARTLHLQAIVYDTEGSKFMGKAIHAAAKETWIAVREARGRPLRKDASEPLTRKDFDEEVDFWFR